MLDHLIKMYCPTGHDMPAMKEQRYIVNDQREPVGIGTVEAIDVDTRHYWLKPVSGAIVDVWNKPETKVWRDMEIIKISDVGDDFSEWLCGQTLPYVSGDDTPSDWAYIDDYKRWRAGLPNMIC